MPSTPVSHHGGNTELECGQLSSCSDTDESCSEETLDMVLNAGIERPCSGEMNDVDEETMHSENDVSFSHLRTVNSLPNVSAPEIDSLTYTEPSMESLASLTTTASIRTPTQPNMFTNTTANSTLTSASNLSLEDEMLLFSLMNLREQPTNQTPSRSFTNPTMVSSLTSSSELASTRERLFPNQGIAPLPSLGTATKNDSTSIGGAGAVSGTTTVPLPSLAERNELTRMPSFQQPTSATSLHSSSKNSKAAKNETNIKSSTEPINSGEDAGAGPSTSHSDERDENKSEN